MIVEIARPLFRGRKRIALVVDDEQEICDLIEDMLDDIDIAVRTATTAEAGLKAVENLVIDIVLIDIFMPGKGGLWLIEQIATTHPEAEIIVISGGWQGMSAEKTLRATEKLGVRHYLSKPFMTEELHGIVVDILAARDRTPRPSIPLSGAETDRQ